MHQTNAAIMRIPEFVCDYRVSIRQEGTKILSTKNEDCGTSGSRQLPLVSSIIKGLIIAISPSRRHYVTSHVHPFPSVGRPVSFPCSPVY